MNALRNHRAAVLLVRSRCSRAHLDRDFRTRRLSLQQSLRLPRPGRIRQHAAVLSERELQHAALSGQLSNDFVPLGVQCVSATLRLPRHAVRFVWSSLCRLSNELFRAAAVADKNSEPRTLAVRLVQHTKHHAYTLAIPELSSLGRCEFADKALSAISRPRTWIEQRPPRRANLQ